MVKDGDLVDWLIELAYRAQERGSKLSSLSVPQVVWGYLLSDMCVREPGLPFPGAWCDAPSSDFVLVVVGPDGPIEVKIEK